MGCYILIMSGDWDNSLKPFSFKNIEKRSSVFTIPVTCLNFNFHENFKFEVFMFRCAHLGNLCNLGGRFINKVKGGSQIVRLA